MTSRTVPRKKTSKSWYIFFWILFCMVLISILQHGEKVFVAVSQTGNNYGAPESLPIKTMRNDIHSTTKPYWLDLIERLIKSILVIAVSKQLEQTNWWYSTYPYQTINLLYCYYYQLFIAIHKLYSTSLTLHWILNYLCTKDIKRQDINQIRDF